MAYSEELLNVYKYGLVKQAEKIRNNVKHTDFLTKFLFGGHGIVTNQRVYQLKVQTKGRPIANQVAFGSHGVDVDTKEGYKLITARFPYYNEKTPITADELAMKCFEEEMGVEFTQQERELYHLAEKRNELFNRVVTAVESKQAIELLSKGTVTVDGVANDFELPKECFYSPSTKLDKASSKQDWLRKVLDNARKGGKMPNTLLVSADVMQVILADADLGDQLDNRRIDQKGLKFEAYNSNMVAYHGSLAIPGYGNVDLVTYDGTYTDSTGAEVLIIPEKTLIACSENIGSINYGGVYDDSANGGSVMVDKMFVDTIINDHTNGHPYVLEVEHQSSPLLAPAQMGGWCYVSGAIA